MAEPTFNTVNTYSPRGVNLADGLRVGNFQLPGSQSTSRGISVVEPVVWTVSPLAKIKFFEQTFTEVGTYYLNLSNSTYYPNGVIYNVTGNQMVLDCERVIKVQGDQAFAAKVSGLTQYNQPVVCEAESVTVDTDQVMECARGMRALTNIRVTISTPNTTISLHTTNKIVIPFANDIPLFLNARYIYPGNDFNLRYSTLFKCETADDAPYNVDLNFDYTQSTYEKSEMLPNSGTSRTILDLFSAPGNYSSEFGTNAVLTIEFLLDSAGTNPEEPYPNNNSLELTIGIEPYSMNWEAMA